MTETTIFQKIINEEIPCDKLYEDKFCIAFNDIQAQAPVHFLVIPKKPIISLLECIEQDANLLGHLLFVGSKIAKSKNLTNWRTVINTGAESGQTVFHLHIHFLSGRKMNWPKNKMNTPESLNTESKNLFNLISKNWEELDDSLKTKLIKIWNVLTYKWQLQILFNLPFLLWWALDKSFPKVHEFDATILNYLNLPDWALSFIGFGQ